MGNKKDSLWGALKTCLIHIIKTETYSLKGKLNLIFGILLILFLFAYCIKGALEIISETIIQCIHPEVNIESSGWIIIILVILTIIYFLVCVKFVDGIEELKDMLNALDKGKQKVK